MYSVELCGGTHVEHLGDIGIFKILSESGVSSGVRRIEAITGSSVEEYIQGMETALWTMAEMVKCSVRVLPGRLEALLDDKKKLEREIKILRSSSAGAQGQETLEKIKDTTLLVHHAKDMPMGDLKPLMDTLKHKVGSGVVLLTSVTDENKATALVGVTEDLLSRYNAKDLIQPVAIALGGKGGGGRPDLAQCGGMPEGVSKAAQVLKEVL